MGNPAQVFPAHPQFNRAIGDDSGGCMNGQITYHAIADVYFGRELMPCSNQQSTDSFSASW